MLEIGHAWDQGEESTVVFLGTGEKARSSGEDRGGAETIFEPENRGGKSTFRYVGTFRKEHS